MNKDDVIQHLQLQPHVEGGYFRRTYCSSNVGPVNGLDNDAGTRPSSRAFMSSIYYLLTSDSSIGHLHCNQSDIVHYYHGAGEQGGGVLRYTLIWPDGRVEQALLGPSLAEGHQWQLIVPGGVWKASELVSGEWGLISEAVCPGFDFADMTLASLHTLQTLLPTRWQEFRHLVQEHPLHEPSLRKS